MSDIKQPVLKHYKDSDLLREIMAARPSFFDSIERNKENWKIQVIYTQVDRNENGQPSFADHFFHLDPQQYFYPASTVKFPIALLALQHLHELNKPGLNKFSPMITGKSSDEQTAVAYDSSSANGYASIAHYIKKIFLVSDNDAFNRLYEFLGQEYINDQLHRMGYADAQIIHRLSLVLNEEQNRHTNPVSFLDKNGDTIYRQPAMISRMRYDIRRLSLGEGYMQGEELIAKPFDFSRRNRLLLTDLHSIMRAVVFPNAMPPEKRFQLTTDDYSFLYKYMSMYPRESDYPFYSKTEHPDNDVKKMIPGNDTMPGAGVRVYSKSGTAYGFLTDVSYIVDTVNNIEFFLTATIYCNSDGIFNDDKYDYDTVGYPFLKYLVNVVYDYEWKRDRRRKPELELLK